MMTTFGGDENDEKTATSAAASASAQIDKLRIQYLMDACGDSSGSSISSSSNTKNKVRIVPSRFSSEREKEEEANVSEAEDGMAGNEDELLQQQQRIQIVRISPPTPPSEAAAAGSAGTTTPTMKPFDVLFFGAGDVDDSNTIQDSSSSRRLEDLERRLPGYLLPYFKLVDGYETVDMETVKAEILPLMQKGCTGGMCPHVSLKSMEDSAAEGNVECHTIQVRRSGSSSSGGSGGSGGGESGRIGREEEDDGRKGSTTTRTIITKLKLYYDDSAHLKRRPLNEYVMKNLLLDTGDEGGEDELLKIHGDVFVVAVGYYYCYYEDDDEGDDKNDRDKLNNPNDPPQQQRETHLVPCHLDDIIKHVAASNIGSS